MNSKILKDFFSAVKNKNTNIQQSPQKESYYACGMTEISKNSKGSNQNHLIRAIGDTLSKTSRRSINRNHTRSDVLLSPERGHQNTTQRTQMFSTLSSQNRITLSPGAQKLSIREKRNTNILNTQSHAKLRINRNTIQKGKATSQKLCPSYSRHQQSGSIDPHARTHARLKGK